MASTEAPIDVAPSHRLLVVDDEEMVLVALRETLAREAYDVVTCSDPLQALKVVEEQTFSVIITDHQMPRLSGLEFFGQVKEVQPEATRILLTAVLSLSTVIEAVHKGDIYRFVVKPWLREELLATVHNAVQHHDMLRRNQVLLAAAEAMNEKLAQLTKNLEKFTGPIPGPKGPSLT